MTMNWQNCSRITGIALFLASLGSAQPASAGGMSPDLAKQADAFSCGNSSKKVIVRFSRPNVDANAVAQFAGGKVSKRLLSINGAAMAIPYGQLKKLTRLGVVSWVSPDRQLGSTADCDTLAAGPPQAWSAGKPDGTGMRVAVLDTGIVAGNADWSRFGSSTSRLAAFKDFVNGQTTPYDDNGHGTHVAGVALGSGNKSYGRTTGTAPDADIVALK